MAIKSVPVLFRFNGDTTRTFAATWSLTSPGPSIDKSDPVSGGGTNAYPRTIWFAYYYAFYTSGKVFTYDPSNGTRSLGHLWRFSSGGM